MLLKEKKLNISIVCINKSKMEYPIKCGYFKKTFLDGDYALVNANYALDGISSLPRVIRSLKIVFFLVKKCHRKNINVAHTY